MPETKTANILSIPDLKNGMTLWAWAWYMPMGLNRPLNEMPPILGVLAETNSAIGDPSRGPGWFVPYAKNAKRPVWRRAVRVESVKLNQSREEAVESYNHTVQASIAQFLELAQTAQDALVKTKRLGFDKHGMLNEYPVCCVDLSGDYDAIIQAASPILQIRPDHGGSRMPWSEFMDAVNNGVLNRANCIADIILDGRGTEHAILDITRCIIYVQDQYLVPFEKVEQVFAGHNPEIIWFRPDAPSPSSPLSPWTR